MALQTIISKKAIEKIKDDVERGKDLDRFKMDDFPIDENDVLVLCGLAKPEGLLDKLDASLSGDFKSAVAIYEAYKNLTPLQAIDEQLWESLALRDLFPYMQHRWSLKKTNDLKKTIKNHFL